jgi:hypothetical protein
LSWPVGARDVSFPDDATKPMRLGLEIRGVSKAARKHDEGFAAVAARRTASASGDALSDLQLILAPMTWTLYYTFNHRTMQLQFEEPDAASIADRQDVRRRPA